MKQKGKFVRFFVKYGVKTPIIYLTIVVIGVSVFVTLTLTTKVPIFETYNGTVSYADNKYSITADNEITENISTIFIYIDKNIATYKINDVTVDGNTVKFANRDKETIALLRANQKLSFDVQVSSMTLFYQIFINGGKN